MEIGKYNKLTVNRLVDFGAYLADAAGTEVLLPARYISEPLSEGDEIEVFVYRDSEDRPVAVTDSPLATVGEFAFLRCVGTSKVGAFLDWGLPKDLLVPFSEQRMRMRQGREYLVYVYLDHASGRVAASAKIEKYLGNVPALYRKGQEVDVLVTERTPIGYACIADNLHRGMLYANELHERLEPGMKLRASVKTVRPDGKLDLVAGGNAASRTTAVAARIEAVLAMEGTLSVTDRSTPAEIEAAFHCSKKDFKKAVGHLLKAGIVSIDPSGSILSAQKQPKCEK